MLGSEGGVSYHDAMMMSQGDRLTLLSAISDIRQEAQEMMEAGEA